MNDLENLCMGCMNDNGNEEVCPICGFDSKAPTSAHALNLKTVLASRYLIGKILLYGGDGITYIAYDKSLNKPVRIKEYYPQGVCARKDGLTVRVKKESAFTYNSGIMEFLELSNKLASLEDMPGIFKVINVFEENGTAYRVMEYTPGINLRDFLLRNGGTLNWEQAKPLFLPIVNALSRLHKAGIIHRGISPETIFIGRDGRPRITDFSIKAARTSNNELTPQLWTGYAALEQYGYEKLEDGEYTDVYGIAATIFKTLIGNPPPEATLRINNDNMSFPKRLAETIPQDVLIALANALQIFPKDRTETIDEFKADFSVEPVKAVEEKPKAKTEVKAKKKNTTDKLYAIKAAIITGVTLLILTIILVFTVFRESLFGVSGNETSSFLGLSSVESVNIVSNTVSHAEKLYQVPDFTGKTFTEIDSNNEYKKWFTFKVTKKEYSSKVAKGKVVGQSVAKDSNVPKDTEIELTISLGPSEVTIPSIKGKSQTDAYIALLELGFEPSNIEFIGKVGDPTTKQNVIETSPSIGSKVSPDTRITVFYNTNIITSSKTDETSSTVEE